MDKRQKILIVDDSEFNRDMLKEILGETYNYLEAENGNQAIQMIGENIGIDLMLLDINMPQMNGFEVLEIMKRSQCIEETPVIMISSEDAVDTMRKVYELGITDYITRPFDSVIVKKRVQNTLGLYMKQKHLINVVYDQVYEKEENNNIMIRILSNVLGSRNSESREHILHIKTATELMLRQLVKITDAYPMTEADISLITTASSLHDIGKIRIPKEILNKPGRLTDEEFRIMKTHSELGADMIQDMHFPKDNSLVRASWEICRWHHERWDGKGYPDGLKGEEIPISAQVVSIVDVYDALTSERCYKKAFDHDTAIQMILDGQCGQFNPILLKCLKELRLQLSKMLDKEKDDNSYYHEVQRLSNEILSDRSLPNPNYSQSILRVMKEKVDFFKANSGMGSIDYNTSSGQLTILNGKQQILYQRNNPDFDLFKEFGVNEEDVHHIQGLLHQTCFTVREGEGSLLSILNKTIKAMPSDMLTSALAIYDSTADKVTFSDFIKDNLLVFLATVGFLALSIIGIILVLLRKARKAEAVAKLAAKDTKKLNDKLEIALKKAEDASLAKTRYDPNINDMSGLISCC
jgi:putative two-component system response regulator